MRTLPSRGFGGTTLTTSLWAQQKEKPKAGIQKRSVGFKPNGFVKDNIVYTNASRTFPDLGEEFEKDAIIYFTDGVNEPRKINAYRAFNAKSNIHGGAAPKAEADFICACPKTPLKPITFLFESDPSRLTNNFIGTQGFQFAYQHIYVDGMETAVSPYSDIAFPPSVLDRAQPRM